jgi:hypothetical protein
MANNASQFIRGLVEDVTPIRPLPAPWLRAAVWCGVSLAVIAVVVLVMSGSAKAGWTAADDRVLLEQLAALATGLTAAAAAFATTVPGYRRWIVWLPLVPLAVWFGGLGHSCIRDGFAAGFSPRSLLVHWGCVPATMLVGAFPAALIVPMLRRGAPLTPRLTTVLAAVAASGLGNFGVRFVHNADASLVVLAWHFTAVFIISMLSAFVGRSLFNWRQLTDRRDLRTHTE